MSLRDLLKTRSKLMSWVVSGITKNQSGMVRALNIMSALLTDTEETGWVFRF